MNLPRAGILRMPVGKGSRPSGGRRTCTCRGTGATDVHQTSRQIVCQGTVAADRKSRQERISRRATGITQSLGNSPAYSTQLVHLQRDTRDPLRAERALPSAAVRFFAWFGTCVVMNRARRTSCGLPGFDRKPGGPAGRHSRTTEVDCETSFPRWVRCLPPTTRGTCPIARTKPPMPGAASLFSGQGDP